MGRVPSTATEYAGRDARYVMNVHGRWETPGEDDRGTGWSRRAFRALEPYAAGTAYTNFLTEDEIDRVEEAYGGNYRRLAEIKGRYDLRNQLRTNMNIRPLVGA